MSLRTQLMPGEEVLYRTSLHWVLFAAPLALQAALLPHSSGPAAVDPNASAPVARDPRVDALHRELATERTRRADLERRIHRLEQAFRAPVATRSSLELSRGAELDGSDLS